MYNGISIQRRKILRDLWLYRTRTALVVLTVAIGVFAVGTTSRTLLLLSRNLNQGYFAANPAHGMLTLQAPFGDDLLETIANLPDIETVEARFVMNVNARYQPSVGDDSDALHEWRTLTLMALPDLDALKLNRIHHEHGLWPPPRQTMLLERQSFGFLDLDIEDALGSTTIDSSTVLEIPLLIELPDGKKKMLMVSGQVHDITQIPTSVANAAYGYITLETLEKLNGIYAYNTLFFTVKDFPFEEISDRETVTEKDYEGQDAYIGQIIAEVTKTVEARGHVVVHKIVSEEEEHPLHEIIEALLFILNALGAFSVVLSAFLVMNIMTALLARQLKEVGAMKTIGAVDGQIQRIYVEMILVVGAIAVGIAIPLATAGARGLAGLLANLFNVDLVSSEIPLFIYGLDGVAGFVIPVMATSIPIYRGVHIPVQQAISQRDVHVTHGGGEQEVLATSLSRLFPLWIRYAWRNTFRRKVRLTLTLITLMIAGGIFMAIVSVQASLSLSLDSAEAYWQEDIRVDFSSFQRLETLAPIALNHPGVVHVEGRLQYSGYRIYQDGRESNTIITTLGLPAETPYLQPTLLGGRWLVPEDENAIVVNRDLLLNEPDLALGDEIMIKFEDQETTWRIVGIVTSQLAGGSEFRGAFAYVNAPYLARTMRVTDKVNRLVIGLDQHGDNYQIQQREAVDVAFKQADLVPERVRAQKGRRDDVRNNFNILITLLFFMSLLFAIVGGLGLMGTMSLNVFERTRELGIAQAIGAMDGTIIRIVTGEGVFVGTLGWFFGILLAIPLSRLLTNTVGQLFLGIPLDYTFPIHGTLLWLGLSILLSGIASYLPTRNIWKLQIREALAYE